MTPEFLLATLLIPAAAGTGSWIWNVERRLIRIEAVKEQVEAVQVTVEKNQQTVEKILFHLIETRHRLDNNGPPVV